MPRLTTAQRQTKATIEEMADFFGLDPDWCAAVAMVESSLGAHQRSPTGCVGVFQMSSIAMKDLLQSMPSIGDDRIDIACGVAFLALLRRRWGTEADATAHFCDPKDRGVYLPRVERYRAAFTKERV
jgi:membrane-bound lytic murein transglycosylase MltF